MPSTRSKQINKKEHLELARDNEKLAKALRELDVPRGDWIITLCFYSAFHYVYSHIPLENMKNDHSALKSKISKHYTRKFYVAYSWLKDRSDDVRYYPNLAREAKRQKTLIDATLNKLAVIKKELGL